MQIFRLIHERLQEWTVTSISAYHRPGAVTVGAVDELPSTMAVRLGRKALIIWTRKKLLRRLTLAAKEHLIERQCR